MSLTSNERTSVSVYPLPVTTSGVRHRPVLRGTKVEFPPGPSTLRLSMVRSVTGLDTQETPSFPKVRLSYLNLKCRVFRRVSRYLESEEGA